MIQALCYVLIELQGQQKFYDAHETSYSYPENWCDMHTLVINFSLLAARERSVVTCSLLIAFSFFETIKVLNMFMSVLGCPIKIFFFFFPSSVVSFYILHFILSAESYINISPLQSKFTITSLKPPVNPLLRFQLRYSKTRLCIITPTVANPKFPYFLLNLSASFSRFSYQSNIIFPP